ncbi:WbuC family cupin fold metalloprotein [Vibrio campbellii]|uniref:WbuC family cupin fold metalloprotein n=1 Tax=Vibrio campbellii TaxID=680 RepID=UPI0005EED380|nr:WbuC family cupin fold metalloprotein [Vibrio campbellii]
MRIIGKDILCPLYDAAALSPRKRAHLNLHSSFHDKVQRLFIALTRGSYVEPHYHELEHQWEMFVVIKGLVRVTLYDSQGKKTSEMLVGEGEPHQIVEFQPHDIHSVECLSESALMLEVKEGPFLPEFAKVLISNTKDK